MLHEDGIYDEYYHDTGKSNGTIASYIIASKNAHPPQNSHFLKVTVPISSINDHFVCVLCEGYLRDAHTIPECLHSCTSCNSPRKNNYNHTFVFIATTVCKSCIYRHFLIQQERTCPKCNLLLKPCPITTLVYAFTKILIESP